MCQEFSLAEEKLRLSLSFGQAKVINYFELCVGGQVVRVQSFRAWNRVQAVPNERKIRIRRGITH